MIQLQYFESIQSVSVRQRLTSAVTELMKTIQDLKRYETDPATKLVVDNFLAYLDKSSQNPRTLQSRSKWLLTYAIVIQWRIDKVCGKYKANASLSESDYTKVGNEIMVFIERIEQHVRSYRDIPASEHHDLIDVLSELVEYGVLLKENKLTFKDETIIKDVGELNSLIKQINSSPNITFDDYHISISDKVSRLCHKFKTVSDPRIVMNMNSHRLQ